MITREKVELFLVLALAWLIICAVITVPKDPLVTALGSVAAGIIFLFALSLARRGDRTDRKKPYE